MPGSAFIDVESRTFGTTTKITASGEIDIGTISGLADEIAAALASDTQTIVIDLQDVEFLDTQCVRLLAGTLQKTTLMGIRLLVLPPDGPARRAIDVTFPMICGRQGQHPSIAAVVEARRTLSAERRGIGRAHQPGRVGSLFSACAQDRLVQASWQRVLVDLTGNAGDAKGCNRLLAFSLPPPVSEPSSERD